MSKDDVDRFDSLEDLSMLLTVVQRMGRTLANTSHASAYRSAREFNELLHQARIKLDAIRSSTATSSEQRATSQTPESGRPKAPRVM